MPNIKQHLTRLDVIVDNVFIPAITDDHICSANERLLLSLLAKKGGLAIPIFSAVSDIEFANSRAATEQLIEHISTAPMDSEQLKTARRRIANTRKELNNTTLQQLREKIGPEQLRVDEGCLELVNNIAIKVGKLRPNKMKFWDALSLKYRWSPKYFPSTCPCGKRFDVDHAMSCMKGGFVHRRHDDVRDLFASLLKDICHDVEVEPHLQPLTGEVLISSANSSDEARLDASAHGFWQRGQPAFFYVRVFNPFAKSHLNQKLDTAFSSNENEKKRHYTNY